MIDPLSLTSILLEPYFNKQKLGSSKLGEKQQLLNFVFSNFQLDGKRLLVTLREPFLTLTALSHQPVSLQLLVTLRTFDWIGFSQSFSSHLLMSGHPQIKDLGRTGRLHIP